MAKSRYSQAIENLTEHLREKEKQRAKWAKEKWFHIDGKIYSFGRFFLPLLFAVSFVVHFLLCAIIYNNIPAIQRMRTGTKELQNTLAKEDFSVYIYLGISLVCMILLLVYIIKLIRKKYQNTELGLFVNSGVLFVFTLVRLFVDMARYPDNSLLGGAPPIPATAVYGISAALFGVMFLYALCLLSTRVSDNKQLKLTVESTLNKILPDEDEAKLLSQDDMAEYIEDYLKKQN